MGGSVEKHSDAEKTDGTFATLTVQLPSMFTGGTFIGSHNGDSRTFALQTEDSAYNCNFVAYYADSEHEIESVGIGYRMELVYSLCYIGNDSSKPHTCDLGTSKQLQDHMSHLSPDESLCCIPLKQNYTPSTFQRLGMGALKGDDKKQHEMISNVDTDNKWKCIIAKIKKRDVWSGREDDDDFIHDDIEEERPRLKELYNGNGTITKAREHQILRQIDLNCKRKVFGDLKKCWRDRCGLDLDENLGYGRVASTVEYTAYILIVFSEELSLERLCKTLLSNGVSEVVRDNALMPRMMRSLIREKNRKIKPSGKVSRKKKMTLSSRECFQLLSLYKNQEMSYKAVGSVHYWHGVKEAPASEHNNLLIDHIYQFSEEEEEDWNEATEPIRWLLFEHVDIKWILLSCWVSLIFSCI
uniref:Prolyl 4-hydroxylase alpha subunit Fe(2+) 2OG dioxygenase domain-containing protein n=1 Tax=Chaetoceros debilis TaxID=122233 RepID=A0A7S3VF36_9STRA